MTCYHFNLAYCLELLHGSDMADIIKKKIEDQVQLNVRVERNVRRLLKVEAAQRGVSLGKLLASYVTPQSSAGSTHG